MQKCWLNGLSLALIAAVAGSVALAQAPAKNVPISAQAERGKQLFLNAPKGQSCGTCHAIGGVGNAVGPDLAKLASVVGARGLVSTIQMTMTAYVQEYKTTEGSFPGIQKEGSSGTAIWDLSKDPPVLHEFKPGDVSSQKQNEKWKHPPSVGGYSQQQLADLVAWLKFAAKGETKEIKASDL